MSRKHKYRVWVPHDADDKEHQRINGEPETKGYFACSEFRVFKHVAGFYIYDECACLKSDSLVWEQFTGLKDANGVEIYEGDVVVYDSNTETFSGERGVGEVKLVFNSCNLAFWWISQETSKPSMFSEINYFRCSKELEVIGNIHQNPELLEEE